MGVSRKRLFLALAEEQDLRLAAHRCKVTQRSIRKEVATLEVEYGTPLFTIETKKATLTEAGERIHRLLFSVEDESTTAQMIRIMQDPMSEHRIAEWMTTAARQTWPDVRIQIQRASGDQQITRLDLGLTDLGMVYGWPTLPHSEISFLRLYDQDLTGFIAHELPPVPGHLTMRELRTRTWIIPSASIMPQVGNLLIWEAQKAGFYPRVIWSHTTFEFINSIRSGSVVGLAPSNFLAKLPPDIARINIQPRITVPFGCLYRTRETSNSVHSFLNLCCRLTQSAS